MPTLKISWTNHAWARLQELFPETWKDKQTIPPSVFGLANNRNPGAEFPVTKQDITYLCRRVTGGVVVVSVRTADLVPDVTELHGC